MMQRQPKILILPAIQDHIGIVQLAKEKGFETITCDNVPQNPAHQYAEKNFDIDLFDYDALIAMAKEEEIDFVWGYATDIGALAAAKISDALALGGNSFYVVDTMSDKAKFRLFLKENGFNCPSFVSGTELKNLSLEELNYPLVIKPVDRASSKGISVIYNALELDDAFNLALEASIAKEVIVEEYIDQMGQQLHGDAIVRDGELVVFAVGDQYFSKQLSQAPIGTVLPSKHHPEVLKSLEAEVARFVKLIGYNNGGINVEARLNSDGELYIIELGPRSGGNYVPELLSAYFQFDVREYLLSIICGSLFVIPVLSTQDNVFQYIWRTSADGQLQASEISNELEVIESYCLKKIGDKVSGRSGADNIISILLLKGKSRAQVEDVYCNPEVYFKLKLVKP